MYTCILYNVHHIYRRGPQVRRTAGVLLALSRGVESDALNEAMYSALFQCLIKGALCAEVIRLRVSCTQKDEILSRNSLRYLSKTNLPIAVH